MGCGSRSVKRKMSASYQIFLSGQEPEDLLRCFAIFRTKAETPALNSRIKAKRGTWNGIFKSSYPKQKRATSKKKSKPLFSFLLRRGNNRSPSRNDVWRSSLDCQTFRCDALASWICAKAHMSDREWISFYEQRYTMRIIDWMEMEMRWMLISIKYIYSRKGNLPWSFTFPVSYTSWLLDGVPTLRTRFTSRS